MPYILMSACDKVFHEKTHPIRKNFKNNLKSFDAFVRRLINQSLLKCKIKIRLGEQQKSVIL